MTYGRSILSRCYSWVLVPILGHISNSDCSPNHIIIAQGAGLLHRTIEVHGGALQWVDGRVIDEIADGIRGWNIGCNWIARVALGSTTYPWMDTF